MKYRSSKFISIRFMAVLTCAMLICAFTAPSGDAQDMPDGPITKENLLSALKYGRLQKDKRQSADWYVAKIKENKVSFQLTSADKQKIRREGKYLGQKGLDSVIKAVRDNYHKEREQAMSDDKPNPPTVSQTMTNSPGSAQVVGDNNTVNLGPQPRTITVEQARKIIEVLRANPSQSITVYKSIIDNEAGNHALQIARVLELGGWNVKVEGIGQLIPPTYGIECRIKDSEKSATICPLLEKAFGTVGIKIIPNPKAATEPFFVSCILVGLRP
jgi:hypothetical protein